MSDKSNMTTLCYIEQDDAYLMLHRVTKEGDINRDKWIGVGGHFEACESPEDCLLREVYEETGLRLRRWRYRGIVTFVSNGEFTEYMNLFTADEYEGSVTEPDGRMKQCSEGVLAWVKKDEIDGLNLWEGDRIFFRLLREERPFFSLKLCYEGDELVDAVLDGAEQP